MELKIEYVPIEKLTPYENNARKHEKFDVNFIKKSIEKFGFDDPIGVWSDKLIIVEGHGRLLAAKELGMKEVPVIRLDHLTDEQRKAYALAHNRTAEMSQWDSETLMAELDALSKEFDLKKLGFAEFLVDDEINMESEEHELNDHNSHEREIECPYCGGKILI